MSNTFKRKKMNRLRKYADGEKVFVPFNKWEMIVLEATERLAGWKYKCAFMNKNGTADKQRTPRLFWETDLKPLKTE